VIYRTVLCSSNQTNLSVSPSLPQGRWFWRVSAVDRAGNPGPSGSGWSFVTPVLLPGPANDLESVRVYPNPIFLGETLRIDRLTRDAKIQIYSLTGIQVFPQDGSAFEVSGYQGDAIDTWTPSSEASGVYFVAVWNGTKGSVIRKVVLIKAPRE
jgi:hypothetical protein